MTVRASLILVAATLSVATLGLAACNRGGAEGEDAGEVATTEATIDLPEQFVGVWAADCARPSVRFAETEIQVYNDGQTYPLTSASYDGRLLVVGYQTGNGPFQETFAAEGENLVLVSGVYDGMDIPPGDTTPMQRCD